MNMSKIKACHNIYQFKITLQEINPPIWRRIQVPENFNFWDLHLAIQNSFGWGGGHLHQFRTISVNPRKWQYIRALCDADAESNYFIDLEERINKWFNLNESRAMIYEYDFGDGWSHRVELEKILPAEKGLKYPLCLDGRRACPPEDCGGVGGYEDLLKIIRDPQHSEYLEMMEWLGGEWNSEDFDPLNVEFEDPSEVLKYFLKNN